MTQQQQHTSHWDTINNQTLNFLILLRSPYAQFSQNPDRVYTTAKGLVYYSHAQKIITRTLIV
jgi:hypothetical protein